MGGIHIYGKAFLSSVCHTVHRQLFVSSHFLSDWLVLVVYGCEGGLCEGGLCEGVSVKGVSVKGGSL